MFNFPDVTGSVAATARQARSTKAKAKSTAEGSAADAGRNAGAARRRPHPVAGRARGAGAAARAAHRARSARARSSRCARAWCWRPRSGSKAGSRSSSSSRRRSTRRCAPRTRSEAARIKNLVTMYENMKPKDAARVFDRLDMRDPGRGGDPDQSAADVRHPGADVAGGGRAAHGRACDRGPRTSRRPSCPRSTASRPRIEAPAAASAAACRSA